MLTFDPGRFRELGLSQTRLDTAIADRCPESGKDELAVLVVWGRHFRIPSVMSSKGYTD